MNLIDRPPTDRVDLIRFGPFNLDRRGGRLMLGGETIPLRPKTWSVLLYLAERPGVLVSKDDLLDAVWPGVAVTPDTLTKSIGELRLALGDDSRAPRWIETVHRRGFRFIAVERGGTETGLPVSSPSLAEASERPAAASCFAGRDAELEELATLFAKAASGQRQIVFLGGPAGVGKTSLVEAFLRSPMVRHASLPVLVGRGACVEQHGSREAYMPLLEALERILQGANVGRRVGLLRRTAPTWLAQMPWLLGDDAEAVRQSLQAARPQRMLREFASFSEALTADSVVVVVLEDLHWSDAATIDLLAVLAKRREPARLLVIGTYRAAEAAIRDHVLSQTVRDLALHRQCVDLPVHELPPDDVRSYLGMRFPGADFCTTLAPVLHRYTDGNPLFMVAVVDHLLSRGWILETQPGWALSTVPERLEFEVPDDVRRLIEMQLSNLTPVDRALLEAASVAGTEFAVPEVAAALGCEIVPAERHCESIARSHSILRVAGRTEWPDGGVTRRYAFTHELYRRSAYDDSPEGQRRLHHRRIGEALELAHGARAVDIAAELAAHFDKGGDAARTVQYLSAAALRARQRLAYREAVGYLEAALAATDRLPDAAERRRRELDLRLALAPLLNDVHGFASEPVRDNADRSHALCVELGTAAQLFEVTYARAHVYAVRSDPTLMPGVLTDLNCLAERLATPAHRLMAASTSVRAMVHRGDFVGACELAEAHVPSPGRLAAEPSEFSFGADPIIASNAHYAVALWMRGKLSQAHTLMRATLEDARSCGAPFSQNAALGTAGYLALLARNPREVALLAEKASTIAAEHGFPYWHAIAGALQGWVQVSEGGGRDGIVGMQQSLAELRSTGAVLLSSSILGMIAEAHLRNGDVEAGLDAVNEGLAIAENTLDRLYLAELWRLKGDLLLAAAPTRVRRKGPPPVSGGVPSTKHQAEQCYWHAIKLARDSDAVSLELRATISLVQSQAAGRFPPGQGLLKAVVGRFGSTETSPELSDARTRLERTAPAGARSVASKRPATRRLQRPA